MSVQNKLCPLSLPNTPTQLQFGGRKEYGAVQTRLSLREQQYNTVVLRVLICSELQGRRYSTRLAVSANMAVAR